MNYCWKKSIVLHHQFIYILLPNYRKSSIKAQKPVRFIYKYILYTHLKETKSEKKDENCSNSHNDCTLDVDQKNYLFKYLKYVNSNGNRFKGTLFYLVFIYSFSVSFCSL